MKDILNELSEMLEDIMQEYRRHSELVYDFVRLTGQEEEFERFLGEARDLPVNEKPEKIHVLIVEPNKEPYEAMIENDSAELQKMVDGYIEVVCPFEDPVALICNEEGKILSLPLNRALYHEEELYDIIAGNFIVCGLGGDDFSSLTPELLEKYKYRFKEPEQFVYQNEKIIAVKQPASDTPSNSRQVHERKDVGRQP